MAVIKDRDITTELRGALIEAKESMDGKRKLNTLDRLIEELRGNNKIRGASGYTQAPVPVTNSTEVIRMDSHLI